MDAEAPGGEDRRDDRKRRRHKEKLRKRRCGRRSKGRRKAKKAEKPQRKLKGRPGRRPGKNPCGRNAAEKFFCWIHPILSGINGLFSLALKLRDEAHALYDNATLLWTVVLGLLCRRTTRNKMDGDRNDPAYGPNVMLLSQQAGWIDGEDAFVHAPALDARRLLVQREEEPAGDRAADGRALRLLGGWRGLGQGDGFRVERAGGPCRHAGGKEGRRPCALQASGEFWPAGALAARAGAAGEGAAGACAAGGFFAPELPAEPAPCSGAGPDAAGVPEEPERVQLPGWPFAGAVSESGRLHGKGAFCLRQRV